MEGYDPLQYGDTAGGHAAAPGQTGGYPPYPFAPPVWQRPGADVYTALRKHSVTAGVCLLVYLGLQIAVAFVLGRLGILEIFTSDRATENVFDGLVFSFITFGGPFLIYSLTTASDASLKKLPLDLPRGKLKTLSLIFIGMAVCMLANYAASYAEVFMNHFGIFEEELPDTTSRTVLEGLTNVLCTAFIPAIVEEFVFRGVIMHPLRKGGAHFAAIISAAIFALAHGRPTTAVFAFLVGLVIAYAVMISGSMWVGMAIHFFNNLYSCVVTDVYGNFSGLSETPAVLFQALMVTLGLAGAAYLAATKSFKIKNEPCPLTGGRKLRAVLLAPPMILAFLALLALTALSIK